jgi:hypothetical protein
MRIFYWNIGTEKVQSILQKCIAVAKENSDRGSNLGYVLGFFKVLSCTLNFILDTKGVNDQIIPRVEEKVKPAQAKQLYLDKCSIGKLPEPIMDGLFHYFGCAREATQSELLSFCKEVFAKLDTIKVENLYNYGTVSGVTDRYGNTVLDLVTKTLEKHGSKIGVSLEEFYNRLKKAYPNAQFDLKNKDPRYQRLMSKQAENDRASYDPSQFCLYKKQDELMKALRSFVPEQKKNRFQKMNDVEFVSGAFDARAFGHNPTYREERLQDFYAHCFVETGLLSFDEPQDFELVLKTLMRPEKILRLVYREVEKKNEILTEIIKGGKFAVKELDLESELKSKMKFKSLCEAYFKDFESSSETFLMLQEKLNTGRIKLLRYSKKGSSEPNEDPERDFKRAVPDFIRTGLMTEGKFELLKKVMALYVSVGGNIKMVRDLFELSQELAFQHLKEDQFNQKAKRNTKKKRRVESSEREDLVKLQLEQKGYAMYEWRFMFEKMILFTEEELEVIQNHKLGVDIARNLSFRRRVFDSMVSDFVENKCTKEVGYFIRRMFTVNEHYSSFNALTYFPSYLEFVSEAMRLFSAHPTKYSELLEELTKKDSEAAQKNKKLVDPVAFVNFSDYKKGTMKELVSSAIEKNMFDPMNEEDLEYIIKSIGGFYTYIPMNFKKSNEALKIMSEIASQTTLEVESVQSFLKQKQRGSCVSFFESFYEDMTSDLRRFTYLKPLIDKLQEEAIDERIDEINSRNNLVKIEKGKKKKLQVLPVYNEKQGKAKEKADEERRRKKEMREQREKKILERQQNCEEEEEKMRQMMEAKIIRKDERAKVKKGRRIRGQWGWGYVGESGGAATQVKKKLSKQFKNRTKGYLEPLNRGRKKAVEHAEMDASILAGVKRSVFSRERVKTIQAMLIIYLQEGGDFQKSMEIFYFVKEDIFEKEKGSKLLEEGLAHSEEDYADYADYEAKENQKREEKEGEGKKRIIDFYRFVVNQTKNLSVIQKKKRGRGKDLIECNIAKRIASGVDIFSKTLTLIEREFIVQLLHLSPFQNDVVKEGFSELKKFTDYFVAVRTTFLKHNDQKKSQALKEAFARFYTDLTPLQIKRNEQNKFANAVDQNTFLNDADYRRRTYFKFIQQQLEPKGLLSLDDWQDLLFASEFLSELNFRETDRNFEILKELFKYNRIYDSAELNKLSPGGKFTTFADQIMNTFYKEDERMMRYLEYSRKLMILLQEKALQEQEDYGDDENPKQVTGEPKESREELKARGEEIENNYYRELKEAKLAGKERDLWLQARYDEMGKLLLPDDHKVTSSLFRFKAKSGFSSWREPEEEETQRGKQLIEHRIEVRASKTAGHFAHDRVLIHSTNKAYKMNENESRTISIEMYLKKAKSFALTYGNLILQLLTLFILEGGDPLKARDFYFYCEDSQKILPVRQVGIKARPRDKEVFASELMPSLNSDILFAKLALQKFCDVEIQSMASTFKQMELWNDSSYSEIAKNCHALIWILMGSDIEYEELEARRKEAELEKEAKRKRKAERELRKAGLGEERGNEEEEEWEEESEEDEDPSKLPQRILKNMLVRHLTTFMQVYTEPEMETLKGGSAYNTNFFFVYPLIGRMIKEVCGLDPKHLKRVCVLRELKRELMLCYRKSPSTQVLRRDSILTMELFVLLHEEKEKGEAGMTISPKLVLEIVDNLRELIRKGDSKGARYFDQVTSLINFIGFEDELFSRGLPGEDPNTFEVLKENRHSDEEALFQEMLERKRDFNYFFYSLSDENSPKKSKVTISKQQETSRFLYDLLKQNRDFPDSLSRAEELLVELYSSILRGVIQQQVYKLAGSPNKGIKKRDNKNENARVKTRNDILGNYYSRLKELLSPENLKTHQALEQLALMRVSTGTDLILKSNILTFEERYKYLLTDPNSVGIDYTNLKVNQMTLIYLIQHYKDGFNISKLLYDERATSWNFFLNASETTDINRLIYLAKLSKSDFIERLHTMKFEPQKLYPFFSVACAKRDLQLIMLIIKIMRFNQTNDESLNALFADMAEPRLRGRNMDLSLGMMMLTMCKPLVCFLFSILEVASSGQEGFVFNEQTINEILVNEHNMDDPTKRAKVEGKGKKNKKATGYYVFYNIFMEARNFDASPFALEYSYRDFLEQLNHFLQYFSSVQTNGLSKFSELKGSKGYLKKLYGCPLRIAKSSNPDQLIHRFEESLTKPMFSYFLTNCDIHKIRRIIMEYHYTKEFRTFLMTQLQKIIEDPLDKGLLYSIGLVATFLCVYLIYLHECFDASHEMVVLFMKALKLFMANKYYEDIRQMTEEERENLIETMEHPNDKAKVREKATFNPDYILRSAFISFSLRMKPGVDYKLFKKLMLGTLDEIDKRAKKDRYSSFVGRTLTILDGALISDIEDTLKENRETDHFLTQCSLKQVEELNRLYPTQVASLFLRGTDCKFARSFVISEGILDIVVQKTLLSGIARLSRHFCYTKNDLIQELPATTPIPANIKRAKRAEEEGVVKPKNNRKRQKKRSSKNSRYLCFITEKESSGLINDKETLKYLFCILDESLSTLGYKFFLETEAHPVMIPFERSKYLSLYLNLKSRAIFFRDLGGEDAPVMKSLEKVHDPEVPFLFSFRKPFILNDNTEESSDFMDERTSVSYLRTWNEIQLGHQLDQVCNEFKRNFLKNPDSPFPKIDGIDISGLHSEKQVVEFLLKICANRTNEFKFVKGQYQTTNLDPKNQRSDKAKNPRGKGKKSDLVPKRK